MTPRCPCGLFMDDGRFVCDRCEERVLNEIVEEAQHARQQLWRQRFLDRIEFGALDLNDLAANASDGSRAVAHRRANAF